MMYGKLNLFLKDDATLSNKEKVEELKKYDTEDLLTLLRNIEEAPYKFEEEIIKAVATCLYDKGFICV